MLDVCFVHKEFCAKILVWLFVLRPTFGLFALYSKSGGMLIGVLIMNSSRHLLQGYPTTSIQHLVTAKICPLDEIEPTPFNYEPLLLPLDQGRNP